MKMRGRVAKVFGLHHPEDQAALRWLSEAVGLLLSELPDDHEIHRRLKPYGLSRESWEQAGVPFPSFPEGAKK